MAEAEQQKKKRFPKYWLSPTNAYLERIKLAAKTEGRKGCDTLISVHLLRVIAALRHQRGCCPNCGLKGQHRKECLCRTR